MYLYMIAEVANILQVLFEIPRPILLQKTVRKQTVRLSRPSGKPPT